MTSSSPIADAGPHASHDRVAIAALAADNLIGLDRDRATSLVGACDSCRLLLADLRSIAAAVHEIAPMGRPPGRDFRLHGDDARRLARGARWFRFLSPLAAASSAVRPVAATLMTLGLAGLILSAGPLLPFAATGAAPRDAALAPAPTTAIPQKSQPEALGPVDGGAGTKSGASVGGDAARDSSSAGTEGPAATNPEVAMNQITQPSLVPYASLLFVLTGIGLLVLRRIARRLP